jgi:hypothetical protein
MSQDTNDQGTMQQTGSQWAEIIGQLFDRLTGKGASATYDFDNLVIDISINRDIEGFVGCYARR